MGGFLRIITNRKRDVMPVDQAAQMGAVADGARSRQPQCASARN